MADFFGEVQPPPGIKEYIGGSAAKGAGLVLFLSNIIKLLVVIAGLYTLLNIILAGYQFISAGGNPESVQKAWAKIWQSLVGLLIVAVSFVLIALFGWLLFGDPTAILNPKIYGPGQ